MNRDILKTLLSVITYSREDGIFKANPGLVPVDIMVNDRVKGPYKKRVFKRPEEAKALMKRTTSYNQSHEVNPEDDKDIRVQEAKDIDAASKDFDSTFDSEEQDNRSNSEKLAERMSQSAGADHQVESSDTPESKPEPPKSESKQETPKQESKQETPKQESKQESPESKPQESPPQLSAKDLSEQRREQILTQTLSHPITQKNLLQPFIDNPALANDSEFVTSQVKKFLAPGGGFGEIYDEWEKQIYGQEPPTSDTPTPDNPTPTPQPPEEKKDTPPDPPPQPPVPPRGGPPPGLIEGILNAITDLFCRSIKTIFGGIKSIKDSSSTK